MVSEDELGAELPDARISGRAHHTHIAIEIAVRVIELRMVEDVEELSTDLECLAFGNLGCLHQTDVKVVDPRSVKELAICISKAAQWTWTECLRVEEQVIAVGVHLVSWIVSDHLAYEIRFIRIRTPGQREIIGALADRDGESSGKTNDAGEVPSLRETLGRVREGSVEWKHPSIAEHEIMSGVERREGPGEPGILPIYPLPESR